LKTKAYLPLIIFFVLTSVIEIIGENIYHTGGGTRLLFLSKPLLMPILMILIWLETKLKTSFDKIIFVGFIFAWLGDIFLMFNNNDLFVFGLASFLICHILYIVGFIKNIRSSKHKPSMLNRFILALLPLFYLIVLYSYIYPYIANNELNKPFLIPVTVYAITIVTMSLFSLWRIGASNRTSVVLMIIGAFVFMISDSLIALNKFVSPFQHANLYIMFTYCAAQLSITLGTIYHSKK